MKLLPILFFLLLSSFRLFGMDKLDFSTELRQAYKLSLELRFGEARAILTKVKQQDPDNAMVDYVENYMDILRIYIDEDKELFSKLEKNKKRRINRIEKTSPNSPYRDYALAEIHLQWAVVRAKFEDYTDAFFEVKNAYKLLKRNQSKYPEFVANKKSLGILHALVGSIPDQYKWGVKLISGMEGTIAQGRREIEEVLEYANQNEFIFEEETIVMYALMMMHVGNRKDVANHIVGASNLDAKKSPLACFVKATVAMHSGENDKAINILNTAPKGKQYHPFHFLDFMMGEAKLGRLDRDAGFYFTRYLTNFKGQNYIKEAYQKMAWHALIQGKPDRYDHYMKACLSKGYAVIDGDKKALRAAKSRKRPNVNLLKSRVLFDGGYYQKAKDILRSSGKGVNLGADELLERQYRLGRCFQMMKNNIEAKMNYKAVIEKGRHLPYYFACKSALEMGRIYEAEKDELKAKNYFNKCLSMRPEEYKNSLHAQAKAGLNRIK